MKKSKICTVCSKRKLIEQYYRNKLSSRDGRMAACKPCHFKRNKKNIDRWNITNREAYLLTLARNDKRRRLADPIKYNEKRLKYYYIRKANKLLAQNEILKMRLKKNKK